VFAHSSGPHIVSAVHPPLEVLASASSSTLESPANTPGASTPFVWPILLGALGLAVVVGGAIYCFHHRKAASYDPIP
jgi:hypothetical protein